MVNTKIAIPLKIRGCKGRKFFSITKDLLANSIFCPIFAFHFCKSNGQYRAAVKPVQLQQQFDGGVAQLVRASDS